MEKTKFLSGADILEMTRQGAARLYRNRKTINDLNVFPIPDGDTGDNMYMTIESGCEEASSLGGDASVATVSEALSRGMLLGARGNSGVILSRIFAGLAKGFSGVTDSCVKDLEKAFQSAVKEAYGAVSVPVEGTILTVLKDGVKAACESGADCVGDWFDAMETEMKASLDRTPDLLPVLKEAGVVDSGGAGLLVIAEGMAAHLHGEDISFSESQSSASVHSVKLDSFTADSVLEFGYCTEFLLRLQTSKVDLTSFNEKVIKDYLDSVGESVVCFRDDSIVKVHVHTKFPGDILNYCQRYGEYLTVKVENMTLQHHEAVIQDNFRRRPVPVGVVAVASGDGLEAAFREAGADEVIRGGQTMNPSAQDFIEAFGRINAETIYVFPNNPNIILTARQAAGLFNDSDVRVISTRTMGDGYVAVASLDKSRRDADALESEISRTASAVTTAMVSRAIRDAGMDGVSVRNGDYIGFADGKILCDSPSRTEVARKLCALTSIGDYDVVLMIYGAGVPAEEAEALCTEIRKNNPVTEIMLKDGGQPVYDYMFVLC